VNTHRLSESPGDGSMFPARPSAIALGGRTGANPTRTLPSTVEGRALLPLKRLEQAGRPAFAPRADESAGQSPWPNGSGRTWILPER